MRAEPIDWSRRPQQILQLWAVGSIVVGAGRGLASSVVPPTERETPGQRPWTSLAQHRLTYEYASHDGRWAGRIAAWW